MLVKMSRVCREHVAKYVAECVAEYVTKYVVRYVARYVLYMLIRELCLEQALLPQRLGFAMRRGAVPQWPWEVAFESLARVAREQIDKAVHWGNR